VAAPNLARQCGREMLSSCAPTSDVHMSRPPQRSESRNQRKIDDLFFRQTPEREPSIWGCCRPPVRRRAAFAPGAYFQSPGRGGPHRGRRSGRDRRGGSSRLAAAGAAGVGHGHAVPVYRAARATSWATRPPIAGRGLVITSMKFKGKGYQILCQVGVRAAPTGGTLVHRHPHGRLVLARLVRRVRRRPAQ